MASCLRQTHIPFIRDSHSIFSIHRFIQEKQRRKLLLATNVVSVLRGRSEGRAVTVLA